MVGRRMGHNQKKDKTGATGPGRITQDCRWKCGIKWLPLDSRQGEGETSETPGLPSGLVWNSFGESEIDWTRKAEISRLETRAPWLYSYSGITTREPLIALGSHQGAFLKGWYRLLDNQIKASLFINNITESENEKTQPRFQAATAAFVTQ